MNETYYTYVNAPIRSIGIEEFSDFVFFVYDTIKIIEGMFPFMNNYNISK